MIEEIYQKPVTEWPEALFCFVEELLAKLNSHYDHEVKSYVRRELAHRLTPAAPDGVTGGSVPIEDPDNPEEVIGLEWEY